MFTLSPITNKITSILPSFLTDTHNAQPIYQHFLFNILQTSPSHSSFAHSMSLLLFHAFLPSSAYLLRTPSAFLSHPVQSPSAHIPHLSVLTALAQLLHQLCLKKTE